MLRRTAQGKMIDINALIAKNEKTRAVGNMKANARGDIIDSQGRVVKTVNERVSETYAKTVGNKSANVVKKAPTSKQVVAKPQEPPQQSIPAPSLTKEELELENSFQEEEIEIEKLKKEEKKNARK